MVSHAALEIRELTASYGPISAVRGIDVTVGRGELISVVGANGAGKSSMLNAIAAFGSGMTVGGAIELESQDISSMTAYNRVRAGLALVPEGRRVLSPFTVLENLELCRFAKRSVIGERLDQVFELFPRLKERRLQLAGSLSGGEQQMLAVARALMVAPAVMLLDEPSMGLSPKLVSEVFDALVALRGSDLAILLVEQNTALAMSVSERCYVLNRGEVVMAGNSDDLVDDPAFQSAYLGLSDAGNQGGAQ